MRLPCPHCGLRDLSEFTARGDARVTRPVGDDAQPMVDYIYTRENPAGYLHELWFHTHGCRAWFIVERDTRTHQIAGARSASQPS